MVSARRLSLAVVALLALMVAAPQAAAANTLVPFRATTVESFTLAMCSPTLLCPTITGSGQATHLGKTSEVATEVVDLAHPDAAGCLPATRTTTLTAANGDQLRMTATGTGCSTGPTTVTAVHSYVVTGGTGRFSGASGSGTSTASVDLASGTSVVTFSGTLSTPGARR